MDTAREIKPIWVIKGTMGKRRILINGDKGEIRLKCQAIIGKTTSCDPNDSASTELTIGSLILWAIKGENNKIPVMAPKLS